MRYRDRASYLSVRRLLRRQQRNYRSETYLLLGHCISHMFKSAVPQQP